MDSDLPHHIIKNNSSSATNKLINCNSNNGNSSKSNSNNSNYQFGLAWSRSDIVIYQLIEQDDAYLALDVESNQITLRPNQLVYQWCASDNNGLVADATQSPLQNMLAVLRNCVKDVAWAELYQQLKLGYKYSLQELAELAGVIEPSSIELAAYAYGLYEQRRLFKFDGQFVIARSSAQIAQWDEQQRLRQQEQQYLDYVMASFDMLQNGQWSSQDNDLTQRFCQELTSIALHTTESAYWRKIARQLGLLKLSEPQIRHRVRNWLELMRLWPGWRKAALLDSQFVHPQRNLAEAEAQARDNELSKLRPFEHLSDDDIYTIDPPGSTDMDDALQVIRIGTQKLRIRVFVTCLPAAILSTENILPQAAQQSLSLYFSDQAQHMLPDQLAEQTFSLLKQQERSTICFVIETSQGQLRLKDISLVNIKVARNMDYAEANQLIEQNSAWQELANITRASYLKRNTNESINPTINLNSDGSRVSIKLEPPSQAGIIVEELAVLVNQSVGNLLSQQKISAFYRSSNRGKDGIYRALFTVLPQRHQGMGNKFYVQVTSPIRRFTDLISQQQLLAYLTNSKLPFAETSTDKLSAWADVANQKALVQRRLQQQDDFYLKCRYVEQNPSELFVAHTRRYLSNGAYRLYVDKLGLQVNIKAAKRLHSDQNYRLRVVEVSPEDLHLKLDLA